MDEDPISQLFPDQEDVDLYAVLELKSAASEDDIKKAYRRAALRHHPDKHANASDLRKQEESLVFQQVGFAYAVLSDAKRRAYYDKTGKTSDDLGLDVGEDGWDAYFEQMFERVNRGKLDEMKKQYQGSGEEKDDIKAVYTSSGGSLEEIMRHVMHSTYEDEARFITLIDNFISDGTLKVTKLWKTTAKDKKARLVREKQGKKEATEAEALAKELGVWDEFYGTGKEGKRRGKGKGASKTTEDEEDGDVEDTAALQALILGRKKNMDSFFDNLASKYAEPRSASKGKRKKRNDEDESPRKKKKTSATAVPDISDAEFDALQQRLFSGDTESATGTSSKEQNNARSRRRK